MIKYVSIGLLVLIAATAPILYVHFTKTKLGYVDTTILFAKYKMADDLKEELSKNEKIRTRMLDSLSAIINRKEAADKKDEKELEYLKREFLYKKESYIKELDQIKEDYSGQIWKQLNQYVIDFSKENHYQLVFGANGQGSIMFGEEAYDLTNQILDYANNKYEGKKAK